MRDFKISDEGMKRIARNLKGQVESVADLVAEVSSPSSFYYLEEFPGMDLLGLSSDDEGGKFVADALVYAIQAGDQWGEFGDNSAAYGKLEAMVEYGVVSIEDVRGSLLRWYNATHEEVPMHDAF